MTAILDKAGRLSQYALVSSDRLAGRIAPAEGLRPLLAGALRYLRVAHQLGGGLAQSLCIAIFHELPAPFTTSGMLEFR